MHAVRQKCRPKHQVLVLNCFPRHHKHNVEVKPNSSELSYLLYYASTRRSKLQKVGEFLDKRTTSDVWKGRIGNVQVTLQIVKALIEKTPRDLPLYASSVLRILRTILESKDLTMIEETVPTFEAFCIAQEPGQLAADQSFIRQYDEIIALYSAFASKDTPFESKTAKTIPSIIRYRKAGLDALKALSSSDILVVETERQLHQIIPPILENVYSDNGLFLNMLEHREEEKNEQEKEIAIKRRQSISTVRTTETEPDPVAASGTTEAADQLAEQEAGVIALQALKNIFTNAPRGQLRVVAAEVLRWVSERVKPSEHFPVMGPNKLVSGSWPCMLFSLICGWAPVQDRYVVLVTAMDILIRSPIAEKDLDNQYVIAVIIGYLLSSSINFIGLSVMDVLVGLVQHILLLLQLGGPGTSVQPLPQANGLDSSTQIGAPLVMEISKTASPARILLLQELQRCIGCLSVHIYYSDQISDMINALLSRLKPSPVLAIADTASAIENPIDTAHAIASSVNLTEKTGVDGFFSFETARVSALQCVKEIIVFANMAKKDGSPNNTTRNPITVTQWEGTQWLLRDPSWKVRAAYVDALLTWARYELKKEALRVPTEDKKAAVVAAPKKENAGKNGELARRAVSNASRRESSPKRKKETFLQLLHLAVYDTAHQYSESEADVLLMHLLLSQLVMKLGVNAAQHGLPMIVRLQEDIPTIESPKAKINVGSLVHGYFWALSVHFCFDGASTGRDIHNEISRRLNHGTWLNSIRVPALGLEQIEEQRGRIQSEPTSATVETQTLKPFDKRAAMVEKITDGYSVTLFSPPTSPPGSPSRTFSQPMLGGQVARMPSFSAPKPIKNNNLPAKTKEALLQEWTREAIIASTTKSETSRSGSTHGSASPTVNTHASKHLSVGTALANGAAGSQNGDGVPSPRRSQAPAARPASGAYAFVPQDYSKGQSMRDALSGAGLGRPHSRRSKHASQSPTPYSTTSSIKSTVRVDDLKKVLGGAPLQHHPPSSRGEIEPADDAGDETGSESMVSYEGSESSFVSAQAGVASIDHAASRDDMSEEFLDAETPRADAVTEGTITPRPLTASSATQLNKKPSAENLKRKASISSQQDDPDIPPVPPLPASLRSPIGSISSSADFLPTRAESKKAQSLRSLGGSVRGDHERPRTSHSVKSKGNSNRYSTLTQGSRGNWSARDLLDDIEVEGHGLGVGGGRVVTSLGGRPPY